MPRVDKYRERYQLEGLVNGVVAGDRLMLARALRVVDDAPELGRELVAALQPHRRGTQVIGITGNPGAGKSTVVDRMVQHLRATGARVGVLAVDPSSPFSGGAILGDRIRMNRHFDDDNVYIRSLATRGVLGGLSRSTFAAVRVLDAAGFDAILLETVGVGQDEVDVVRLADTTVVVLVPGLGDDIQAIKAGVLEIADIFLINKADKEGVHNVERGLKHMLSLAPAAGEWEPPIVQSVAVKDQGIKELMIKISRHAEHLKGPEGEERRRLRQRDLFDRLFDTVVVEQARRRMAAELTAAADRVLHQGADPYQVVEELLGEGH